MDPVGVDALREAIRHHHGVESTWVDSARWTEVYQGGEIIWDGDVQVFSLDHHPTASHAYAWSYAVAENRRDVVTVLEPGTVLDPIKALRAWIAATPSSWR